MMSNELLTWGLKMKPMVKRITPSSAVSMKFLMLAGRSPGLGLIWIPPTLMKVGGCGLG